MLETFTDVYCATRHEKRNLMSGEDEDKAEHGVVL